MQLRVGQFPLDGVLAGRVKMKLQKLVLIGKAGADSNFAAVFIRHFHDMPCVLHYERCIAITESNILENGSNCVGRQNVHGSLLLADLRQRRACAHDRSASRKGVIVAAQKSPAVRSDWRIRIMVPRLSRRHRCRQTNQNNEQQTFPCSVHHLFSSVSMGDYTANKSMTQTASCLQLYVLRVDATGNANSGPATVQVCWHEIPALMDHGIWCVPSAPNPNILAADSNHSLIPLCATSFCFSFCCWKSS